VRSLPRDAWAGLVLVAIGAAAILLVQDLPMGRLVRMGPAYLPMVLGGLLAVLGAILAVQGFVARGEGIGPIPWRPLLLIPAALVVFGLAMRHLGLIPATFLLVAVATLAGHERRWVESLVSALVLSILCAGVFRYALNLPIALWPGQ
jgi:hypothetical protein